MKKFFKRSTVLALSLAIGLTPFSFAQNKQNINAYLDNQNLYIDSNAIKPSAESKQINYKNHIYVPLRFIAEKLNMQVMYDQSTKSITILSKEQKIIDQLNDVKNENEKLKQQNAELKKQVDRLKKDNDEKTKKIIKNENNENLNYKRAPITYKDKDFKIKYTTFVRENNNDHSAFYFEIKNDNDYGINIDFENAKFTYNKPIAGTDDVQKIEVGKNNVLSNELSTKIMSTIQQDFDDTGYFVFNKIPDDVHEGILTFSYYKYGDENNKKEVKFGIKLDD